MNALRYYIKADSHSGLAKSLQSFYKPLMKERQCSLKTKQCNKKSCTHDFKPDVGAVFKKRARRAKLIEYC